ncbi:MAG: recombination protein O N-terminal domain-containing protein, partial [Bacteroidaceae bacterium]|nr:recombination protein O N-terminal domain-containing protein [Bacteroidaceae bacterium]
MDQQLEGIVLRTIKYNDRYLIADMYTNKLGRASFLVPK